MPTSLRRPRPIPTGRRRRDVGRALGAVAVLALLIAGLPALVVHFTGLPNPGRLPGWSEIRQLLTGPDTGRLLAVVLAAVFWLAWTSFGVLVLLEMFAVIVRRPPLRLPALGPMQELARTLVAGVALLFVPATLTLSNPPDAPPTLAAALAPAAARQHAAAEHHGMTPGSQPVRTPTTPTTATTPTTPTTPAAAQTVPATRTNSRPAGAGHTYQVLAMHDGQRDTLWRIAEQHLRDPLRWPEIYQLNAGKPQPDGATLTDPHWIRPGWLLLLPADATGLPAPPTTSKPAQPAPPPPAPPVGPQPTPAPPPSAAPPPAPAPPPSPAAPVAPGAPHHAAPPAPSAPATSAPERIAPALPPGRWPSAAADPPPAQPSPQPASASPSVSAPSVPVAGRPGGSGDDAQQALVGTALAGGLAAALAINRQRRRRGYSFRPPRPAVTSGAPPLPAAVRRLLAAGGQHDKSPDDLDGTSDPGGTNDTDELGASNTGPQPQDAARLYPLSQAQIGHRAGAPVTLDLLAQPGLAATGDGAASVLRHLLFTLLFTARPYELELLVTPGSQQLLPVATLEAVRRADTVDRALLELQTAVLTRTRRFQDAGALTFDAYRRQHPEDPLSLLVLVSGPVPQAASPALTAVLAAGQPLGITAIVLGDPPSTMAHLNVTTDATIIGATPAALRTALGGVQLFGLSEQQALAALAVLRDDQPRAAGLDHADVPVSQQEEPPPDSHGSPAGKPTPIASPVGGGSVAVRVLGQYTISAWGEQITSGLRRSAKELLVYFLLHPEGASAESAATALWPEVDAERGRERFWTAMGNLRTRLRNPQHDKDHDEDKDSDATVITRRGERYQIQDGVLSVDLWDFQAALTEANNAAGSPAEADALTRAAELYRGDLAGEVDYWWAETAREELHRTALHTLVRLAELHTTRAELPPAIDYLQRAVRLDPHAEEIHRRLIRALTTAGRDDEALRSYRQLAGRLADIDLEPDDKTELLVAELQLVSRPQVRRRQQQAR